MKSARFVTLLITLTSATFVAACSSSQPPTEQQPAIQSSSRTVSGGVVITDEMIGRRRGTMPLTEVASDSTYAWSQASPVQIGGGFGEGSDRTYRYLNSLVGPHGEKIAYTRVGTCCPFKTPNSPFQGQGVLEVYEITVGDARQSRRIYFDWYDESRPLIPVGLSATH